MFLVDLDSLFIDEKIWETPWVFRPYRFLDKHGLFKDNEAHIPFSFGPRDCMGISFAKMQLFLWLSSTIQKFRIDSPEGADLSIKTLNGRFTYVHSPKAFKIVAIARE